LRGDAATAADWLRKGKSLNVNFPSCAHIQADTDFDVIRDDPAFQAALRDFGC
jgi:hypothetical protein